MSSGARCAANPRVRGSTHRAQPGSGGSLAIRPSRWASSTRAHRHRFDGRSPHRHRVERLGQRPEPGLHRVDPLPSLARHRSPFDPLRGRGEGIGRLADRGLEAGRQPIEVRRIRRIRLHRRAGVAHEFQKLPARQLHTEERVVTSGI